MKRKLLFISGLMLVTSSLLAQGPTITSSFSPYVGLTSIEQPAGSAGVSYGTSGANKTWDYTNLTDSGSLESSTYETPSSTGYQSTFPNSNVAAGAVGGGAYAFYISNSNVFQLDGLVTSLYNFYYSVPEDLLEYPLSNSSVYTANFVGTYTYDGETDDRTGKDSIVGAGYGTLELPNGHTFKNVLRVELSEDYTDVFTPGDDTITERTYSISYLSASLPGEFLVEISELYEYGTYISTSVSYYPNAPADVNDITPLVQNLNVFPNPSYSQSTLSLNLKEGANINVYVTNIIGQRIKTIATEQVDAGQNNFTIETADMAKGLYLITVEVNGAIAGVQKLEVE